MATFDSSADLIRNLKSVLFRQRIILITAGLLTSLAVVVAILVGLSLVANVMVLPVWLKISLLGAGALLTSLAAVRYVLIRLLDGNIMAVAAALEIKNPELKGQLIAAVQFARSRPHGGFSRELVAMTERQALEKAAGLDFSSILSFSSVIRTGRSLFGAVLLAGALLLAFPGLFTYSYHVYSNVTTEVAPSLDYHLLAVPESTEWVKYRDIEIGAVILGQHLPEKAYIHHRLSGGSWQKTKVDIVAIPKVVIEEGDSTQFGITLRQISRSFDFYVEAGKLKTDIQQIDVVDRPRVSGIELSVFYPEYTGLDPMIIDENNGSFSAVVGSRANMKISANLPMESAELVFEDSSRSPMAVDGRTAATSLQVERSRSYYVELLDHLGEYNPDPIEYYITAVPDQYPSADVIRPGYDVNLGDEMLLPLKVRIFDDYGFTSLVLKYTVVSRGRASEEHVAVLHYSDKVKTEGEIEFNWDMESLNLYPGDYVGYYFEVADNDAVSGPKISRSRQYIARLPSLDEMIAEVESGSRNRVLNTEELVRSGKELVQRVKQVARKLEAEARQTRKADWQHQKELETVSQKNAEIMDKVDQMAEEMEKSLEKMQENTLLSRQVLEKLAEIQKLFEEVATPEMKEAQQRLMEALRNMDRQEIQDALKDFEMSQEELIQRLERTLALLKRMQLEQKMEAMLRKAEQLAEQQEDVNKKTDEADEKELTQLSKPEDEIRERLEQLKSEVDDLENLMKEAGMSDSPEAKEFAQALSETDADQDMRQMSQALQGTDRQQASEKGSQAHRKLTEMIGEMQEQLLAMQGGDAEQMARAMRKAIEDANYLSQNQEELISEAAALDPRSMVLRETASRQQDLAAACDGLKNTIAELGKQSPFVAAELQSLLNDADNQMGMASQEFENKRGVAGMRYQRDAMSGLNKAAIRLMESLDQQNQCNKGKNCNQGMAKLESLCNKQNQLNQSTQNQCKSQGTTPASSDQLRQSREGLRRLAGEQGAIRKSLEDLAREFGNSRQILGRLDDISTDMKDVEEALSSGTAGEETTQRQLKILSRMLDASRSLQRRDFTEQRKAASATTDLIHIPSSLPAEIFDDRIQLEDRLRKFLGTGYPVQYEEQIKAYFRALLKAQAEAGNQLSPSGPEQ